MNDNNKTMEKNESKYIGSITGFKMNYTYYLKTQYGFLQVLKNKKHLGIPTNEIDKIPCTNCHIHFTSERIYNTIASYLNNEKLAIVYLFCSGACRAMHKRHLDGGSKEHKKTKSMVKKYHDDKNGGTKTIDT